ncbi:hypothetical protein GCM10009753_79740 [Streptantibioticus ferralitis]
MEVIRTLQEEYGLPGVLDFSAVLLTVVARNCPLDRYRTVNGRSDATRLTLNGTVDAVRVLHATALANCYRGRSQTTAADISDTEQQIAATDHVRHLMQDALDVAPLPRRHHCRARAGCRLPSYGLSHCRLGHNRPAERHS